MMDQDMSWNRSTYSDAGGNCLEVAVLPDGRVGVRDSKAPEAGVVSFTRAGVAAWLSGVKAGVSGPPVSGF